MECSLTGLGADEADLRGTRVRDCVISAARLPSLRAGRGDWRDVRIEGARIGSAEMYETNWGSVHFVDCKITYLNLRGATLRDVAFTRCSIEELDLAEATAQSVAFIGSSVPTLDVQRAQLKAFDLRGAELHRITGLSRLNGTTVSSVQLDLLAPLLAAEFGMAIDDTAPPEIP
nr:pentapeptide repeat-containing protein [Kineosporia mesophila]